MLQILAAVMSCDEIEQISEILSLIADLLWCSVCACMQAQHKHQLDIRDGVVPPKHPERAAGGGAMSPPQAQQMF